MLTASADEVLNGRHRTIHQKSLAPRSLSVLALLALTIFGPCAAGVNAQESSAAPAGKVQNVARFALPVGVTRRGTVIPGDLPSAGSRMSASLPRVVIVAGLTGPGTATQRAEQLRDWLATAAPEMVGLVAIVPCANPDAQSSGLETAFPPPAGAYHHEQYPEAQYLWRWIAIFGADAVVELRAGTKTQWHPAGGNGDLQSSELAQAVQTESVAKLGTMAGWRVEVPAEGEWKPAEFFAELKSRLPKEPSAVHRELRARAARTPLEVAQQLEKVYGHKLEPVEYLQGTAVIGRLRLSELLQDAAMRADVERIASRWLKQPTLSANSNGSNFAGHLIFAELAQRQRHAGYVELVRQVAERGFDELGQPRAAMPSHSEMSDAVYMSTPILVEAGRLTGDSKYYEMADRHLRFMLTLNLRNDGLHRHSPLDETAWGRGNGFPALGLALCLDRLPADRPEFAFFLQTFQNHLHALRAYQDRTGMWHQVIDHPESYRELTATCMITYAMLRGLQQGWLPEAEFRPCVQQAWEALKLRIGSDGTLFDVCTGTGKQKNLRAYYDREAILGKDARGGAMSLLVATEMARWQSSSRSQ